MTSALKYVMAQYKNFLRDQENRNKDIYDPLNGFFCSPQEDFFKWNFTLPSHFYCYSPSKDLILSQNFLSIVKAIFIKTSIYVTQTECN